MGIHVAEGTEQRRRQPASLSVLSRQRLSSRAPSWIGTVAGVTRAISVLLCRHGARRTTLPLVAMACAVVLSACGSNARRALPTAPDGTPIRRVVVLGDSLSVSPSAA